MDFVCRLLIWSWLITCWWNEYRKKNGINTSTSGA
jgi:hypothetical protein